MGRMPKPPSEDVGGSNAIPNDQPEDERAYTRREALAAVKKYSAVVAGSATVILTADDVLAQVPCSRIFRNGNGPPPDKGPQRCRR